MNYTTYEDYYLRAINSYLKDSKSGLSKLVLGPTGLGKTHAIPLVIKKLRDETDKRFIYTTHRHVLLEEMEQKLADEDIPSVYLLSNREVVQNFVETIKKNDLISFDNLERHFFKDTDLNVRQVKKIIDEFLRELKYANELSTVESAPKEHKEFTEQRLKHLANKIMRYFREAVEKNPNLISDPLIWDLFPYIKFMEDKARSVLLTTVHKLMSGFFNGQKTQRITSLSNNIIFIDEFDVQEDVILDILTRNPGIDNNFEFVRRFYEEMTIHEKGGKLTQDDKARKNIREILSVLRKDCQNEYNFPEINRFTMDANEFKAKSISMFQSGHIVRTAPFFLIDENPSWKIVDERIPKALPSGKLFFDIQRAKGRILDFFAELLLNDMEYQFEEWLHHCYNRPNDNEDGRYSKIIREYTSLRSPLHTKRKLFGQDIRDSVYYRGYNLYTLQRGAHYQYTWDDDVKVKQESLHITPEYILWQLCQNNAVFGISATGDLPRYVKAFDLAWIKQKTNYIPIDENDVALIREMKAEKASTRSYTVEVSPADKLPQEHPLNQLIETMENIGEFNDD